MNHFLNQVLRILYFGIAMSSALHVATAAPSDSAPKLAASTVSERESPCEPIVRPIVRAIAPAKHINGDWTTMPSTYTHDSQGQRVDQYALSVEPQSNERADFTRSGYRNTRSSLQAGFSADHYHVTEQWGQPVQPYGQWRYPYRPFSVPYDQWGPQLPQVVVGGNQWNTWGARRGAPGLPGNGNPGGGGGEIATMQPGMNGPVAGQGRHWPTGPGGGWGPNWNGLGNGQSWGQSGGGLNGLGVGPSNALPAGQDEYYQEAPVYHPQGQEYHPLRGGGFQTPFRD